MAKRPRIDSAASTSQQEAYSFHNHASPKYIHLEEEEDRDKLPSVMQCLLPPHAPMKFQTYDDYDAHYLQFHTNRCCHCYKNFPSEHFLDLHIRENHDSIVAAQKDRGEKTYLCFVEDCTKICSAPHKRRMHLMAKHHFPGDYDFFIVNDGLGKRSSMLRSKPNPGTKPAISTSKSADKNMTAAESSSTSTTDPHLHASMDSRVTGCPAISADLDVQTETTEPSPGIEDGLQLTARCAGDVDTSMDNLTRSMSALKFVPRSIRFGKNQGRGLSKR